MLNTTMNRGIGVTSPYRTGSNMKTLHSESVSDDPLILPHADGSGQTTKLPKIWKELTKTYKFSAFIGEGTFGKVILATQIKTG